MNTVAVYVSGVPAKTKHTEKRELLYRFGRGVKQAGDKLKIVDGFQVLDADVAVIQGWIGMKIGAHLKLRETVINYQRQCGKHTLVIDRNLFGFLNPNNRDQYLCYSLDGIFPTTGFYFDTRINEQRWESIKRNYGFTERPWKQGDNILITLQRNHGWSMGQQLSVQNWLNKIIPEIRQHTDRPIIIRPHPGDGKTIRTLQITDRNWKFSSEADIRGDFENAWATVTYNSSPGAASLIWGVPAFVTDPKPDKSQAYPWASADLSTIAQPYMPDRRQFYNAISQSHFNNNELESGEAWAFMRERLVDAPKTPTTPIR